MGVAPHAQSSPIDYTPAISPQPNDGYAAPNNAPTSDGVTVPYTTVDNIYSTNFTDALLPTTDTTTVYPIGVTDKGFRKLVRAANPGKQ